jgi:hypothetical protein
MEDLRPCRPGVQVFEVAENRLDAKSHRSLNPSAKLSTFVTRVDFVDSGSGLENRRL